MSVSSEPLNLLNMEDTSLPRTRSNYPLLSNADALIGFRVLGHVSRKSRKLDTVFDFKIEVSIVSHLTGQSPDFKY